MFFDILAKELRPTLNKFKHLGVNVAYRPITLGEGEEAGFRVFCI